ncbi:MAG: PrpF family protein [Rhodospirillales bacterium]|nr:PrpF family protein [Rhodospirillales bacterium]
MTQLRIPAVFMRGGSSKGVFFKADDLPQDRNQKDRIFLKTLGSPDAYGRQLNGMGGGVSSLSKAVILSKSTSPDIDIEYNFAQIAVGAKDVDYSTTCGNLSSAVGPFAIDHGLVEATGDMTRVRVRSVNTGKTYHAYVPTLNGCFNEHGSFDIPGVSGTGSQIRLDYLDPGGATTGALLPTGNVRDIIQLDGEAPIEVSIVDASTGQIVVAAERFGLSGAEQVDELEANKKLMALLDRLRRACGVLMGLATSPDQVPLGNPRIALIAPLIPYQTLAGETVQPDAAHLSARITSMGQIHRVMPLTGAMCLGVACRIKGSVAYEHVGEASDDLLFANPSGVLPVDADVQLLGAHWVAKSVTVYRTARALMEGFVLVPNT